MKILIVHNRYFKSRGGEDTTVEAESKLLLTKGHEVQVLYFHNENADKNLLTKARAAVRTLYNAASAKKLRNQLMEFRPDIIHIHNFFFEASPAIIIEAFKASIPVVVTIQNYRLICANALLLRNGQVCELCVHKTFPWYGVRYKCYHDSALESMVVGTMSAFHKIIGTWKNKVQHYITPSEFMKSKLVHSSLHLPASKISVKRNFIEDPGDSEIDNRKDYFLFVGRLSVEKGIGTLLECFSKLPGSQLVVAGNGPQAESLIGAYSHLKNVRFAGQVSKEEVIGLMKHCRALIFPSGWYEGAPLTITEAFATGTPVLASRLGAMEEMVRHNLNGLLFTQGSSEALEQAIATMNDMVRKGNFLLYSGARQTYLDYYHPDKCYADVMDIYRSVTEQKM